MKDSEDHLQHWCDNMVIIFTTLLTRPGFSLVNIEKNELEHHHFSWANQL